MKLCDRRRNFGCFRDVNAFDRRNLVDPSGMIAEIRVEGAKLGSGVSGIVVGERCLGYVDQLSWLYEAKTRRYCSRT